MKGEGKRKTTMIRLTRVGKKEAVNKMEIFILDKFDE
jgi:hypothetical protein